MSAAVLSLAGPRGSPQIALAAAQSDLPPLPRRTLQLPGGAARTRREGYFSWLRPAVPSLQGAFGKTPPASPDAPAASESCRVSAPRQRPGIGAEGETARGPNRGLALAKFHVWGSNRLNSKPPTGREQVVHCTK